MQRERERYDPITGEGCCGPRCRVTANAFNEGDAMVPQSMVADPLYNTVVSHADWVKLRCCHDFEYWAVKCVNIRDKLTGRTVPFRLNYPQRRIAAMLEADRLADRPLRLILLKARQWGGSTLVQMYMAWIQTCLRRNWHSVICAHQKDTSANIRGMYDSMLANYPKEYWQGDEKPRFCCFQNTRDIRVIADRDCRITLATSVSPEAIRGSDIAMAHLSEVAFWVDTPHRTAESVIRAICGSVAMTPLSLVVMESTANGYGNYFHDEWLRAVSGESDKRAVFVPWYEIEIYRLPVSDDEVERLWESFDDYEHALWDKGLTLEQIKWYHMKRKEYPSINMMHSEYPSDDKEAFVSTILNVFSLDNIEEMRKDCREGVVGDVVGDAPSGEMSMSNVRFLPDGKGEMEVWKQPELIGIENRYMAVVDVGGVSANSDFSVISVFDRAPANPKHKMEVVAQWRGHIDMDLLLWKAAAVATYYDNALLVIESNSLETSNVAPIEMIADAYPNLYRRIDKSTVNQVISFRYGFHTNRETKPKAIAMLVAAVREHSYCERSKIACVEMATYSHLRNGGFGAPVGYHDDVLITRAIALFVNLELYSIDLDSPSEGPINPQYIF